MTRSVALALVWLSAVVVGACSSSQPPSDAAAATGAPTTPEAETPKPASPQAETSQPDPQATQTPQPDTQAAETPRSDGPQDDAAGLAALQAFVQVDPGDDGPFYMVNLIEYRDLASYADGRATDLTGEEADAIYGTWMSTERLPATGAEIVYVAEVETDLIGDTSFDRVAVVRYPSRADFWTMVTDPEFQAMLEHKDAGVANTTVLATSRLSLPSLPDPAQVPYPATDDDPPFAFMHVLDYRDTADYQPGDQDADNTRSGADAVDLYSRNAGTVAGPLGVRPWAWFDVEAVISGDHDWDEVRINGFPSHATFAALTSDPTWQAGRHHRTAGLEATYAIQTLPVLNSLGDQ